MNIEDKESRVTIRVQNAEYRDTPNIAKNYTYTEYYREGRKASPSVLSLFLWNPYRFPGNLQLFLTAHAERNR